MGKKDIKNELRDEEIKEETKEEITNTLKTTEMKQKVFDQLSGFRKFTKEDFEELYKMF